MGSLSQQSARNRLFDEVEALSNKHDLDAEQERDLLRELLDASLKLHNSRSINTLYARLAEDPTDPHADLISGGVDATESEFQHLFVQNSTDETH